MMTAASMAARIHTAISALGDPAVYPGGPSAYAAACMQALCGGIIAEIQLNGTVTVTVASVGGVTTGVGVSGPGTGTGVIS